MLPTLVVAPTTTLVLATTTAPLPTLAPVPTSEVTTTTSTSSPSTATTARRPAVGAGAATPQPEGPTEPDAEQAPEPDPTPTVEERAPEGDRVVDQDQAAGPGGAPGADGPGSPPSAATSVRQGGSLTFAVPGNCPNPVLGTLDPTGTVLADGDDRPGTFTIDATGLRLGSYLLSVQCENGLTVQSEVMVFRQNGATRGGANSVAAAGAVGLGSALALVGIPGPTQPPMRRRPDPAPHLHPAR